MQDESHFLKNIRTARCKAALPLLKVLVFYLSIIYTEQVRWIHFIMYTCAIVFNL